VIIQPFLHFKLVLQPSVFRLSKQGHENFKARVVASTTNFRIKSSFSVHCLEVELLNIRLSFTSHVGLIITTGFNFRVLQC